MHHWYVFIYIYIKSEWISLLTLNLRWTFSASPPPPLNNKINFFSNHNLPTTQQSTQGCRINSSIYFPLNLHLWISVSFIFSYSATKTLMPSQLSPEYPGKSRFTSQCNSFYLPSPQDFNLTAYFYICYCFL